MTWQSSLQLSFEHVEHSDKTRLFHRAHSGALMVQRALYPEPDTQSGICHIYVLYPPAGIADNDKLTLDFKLQPNSHAVITTPGAGKWYGQRLSLRPNESVQSVNDCDHQTSNQYASKQHSNTASSDISQNYHITNTKNSQPNGQEQNNNPENHASNPKVSAQTAENRSPLHSETSRKSSNATIYINPFSDAISAEQHINAHLDDHTILEWLPQESIYYDHSVSNANNRFYLARTASLLTWDIAVFGRQAYQETFANGHYTNRLEIWRDDQLLVSEHTAQQAQTRWFTSPLGLNNQHVHGSFWAIPSTDVIAPHLQSNPLKLGQYLDDTIAQIRTLIEQHSLPIHCTHNYQGINCRYLGGDVRACFDAFYQVRELIRHKWYSLKPHRPRIWDT